MASASLPEAQPTIKWRCCAPSVAEVAVSYVPAPELTKVAEGGCAAPRRCVAVIDASHHQQLLGDRGRHDPGAAGSWDQAHQHGAAAPSDLQGHNGSHLQNTPPEQPPGPGQRGTLTLQGTVCGFPILLPQYPRRTGTMDSLARMMAPRMAVATSLEHFTPSPTWPL